MSFAQSDFMSAREQLDRFRSWKIWVFLGSVILLALVHQISGVQTSRFHQVLDVAPYIFIMAGGFWFGFSGALATSVLTSICYTAHLVLQEDGDLFHHDYFHRTLNIFMYLIVGLFTGILAERQLAALRKHKSLAAELDESYRELRKRTEELFRAQEGIQRANRLSVVGELSAGLAHEIGNPLGGIKGAAEILADKIDPETEEGRFVGLVLKEVSRLDEVVSRFLQSVRIDDAGVEEANLREVLDSVLTLSRQRIEAQGLEIRLNLEEGLPRVNADTGQLRQVFLNLLLNAMQATAEGGTIEMTARSIGSMIECAVSDSGTGIPAEDLPRIFDPFFTRRVGGTGLGLAITYKIVEACGGEIDVESEVGRGTKVRVNLPAGECHDSN